MTGTGRSPRATPTSATQSPGRPGQISGPTRSKAPTGPTAGCSGGTASGPSTTRSASTAASPRAAAAGTHASGPQVASAASGTTTKPNHGIATRLASGESGARSWNHQAAAGSVPTVAATLLAAPRAARSTGLGRSGGIHRVRTGVTRTRPTMAPKDSCMDGEARAGGSTMTTPTPTRPSSGSTSTRRPAARPAAASASRPAARCALTGAPAPQA